MTITLHPEQEQAIQPWRFRSVDEFINAAIATLPGSMPPAPSMPRKSRLWELRRGLTLGDLSIEDLIAE